MAFVSRRGRPRPSTLTALQAEIYDEQTFHHFLSIERWRAEETGRSFFLVLVNYKGKSSSPDHMPPDVSAAIFSVLARCVREVDFIGWYSQNAIVGAVMTQSGAPRANAADVIVRRFTDAFRLRLPERIPAYLAVRVIEPAESDGTH